MIIFHTLSFIKDQFFLQLQNILSIIKIHTHNFQTYPYILLFSGQKLVVSRYKHNTPQCQFSWPAKAFCTGSLFWLPATFKVSSSNSVSAISFLLSQILFMAST